MGKKTKEHRKRVIKRASRLEQDMNRVRKILKSFEAPTPSDMFITPLEKKENYDNSSNDYSK